MNGHDNGNAPPTPDTICDPDAPTVRLFKAGRHRAGTRRHEITVAELCGSPVGTPFRLAVAR